MKLYTKMICSILVFSLMLSLVGCVSSSADDPQPSSSVNSPESTEPSDTDPTSDPTQPPKTTVPVESSDPSEPSFPESDPIPSTPPTEEEPVPEIDETDEEQLRAWFEVVAKNYIIKYTLTTYLAHENDFVTGTILEFEDLSEIGDMEFVVNGKSQPLTELWANMDHFRKLAKYYQIYMYVCTDPDSYLTFDITFSDAEIVVDGDTASVSFGALACWYNRNYYDPIAGPSAAGDDYIVHFGKINGKWYIIDAYSHTFEYYCVTRDQFNPDEAIDERLRDWVERALQEWNSKRENP